MFLTEVDPPEDAQEIGEKVGDEANAFVLAGYHHEPSNWTRVIRLVEEHGDGVDPFPEGMGAFGYNVANEGEGSGEPDENDTDEDDGRDGDD